MEEEEGGENKTYTSLYLSFHYSGGRGVKCYSHFAGGSWQWLPGIPQITALIFLWALHLGNVGLMVSVAPSSLLNPTSRDPNCSEKT